MSGLRAMRVFNIHASVLRRHGEIKDFVAFVGLLSA